LDAEVFVLLQDWASEEWLAQPPKRVVVKLGRDPTINTNQRLETFLRKHFRLELGDTYATNLFPFVKPGSMNARIKRQQLVEAARRFGLPQIRIVRPCLVVCLGLETFNAVRAALGRPAVRPMEAAIADPFKTREGTLVWCQAHTGSQGQNTRNRGRPGRTNADWKRMARRFFRIRGVAA
jgi:restriction system protein